MLHNQNLSKTRGGLQGQHAVQSQDMLCASVAVKGSRYQQYLKYIEPALIESGCKYILYYFEVSNDPMIELFNLFFLSTPSGRMIMDSFSFTSPLPGQTRNALPQAFKPLPVLDPLEQVVYRCSQVAEQPTEESKTTNDEQGQIYQRSGKSVYFKYKYKGEVRTIQQIEHSMQYCLGKTTLR